MHEQDTQKQSFSECAKKAGFILNNEQDLQFTAYRSLLLEWNKKIDLTTITDPTEIDNKHFLDSLSILRFFPQGISGRVIDIGTGAGFPSIPLKIMYPKMALTLVDSLNKRILFLEQLVQTLGLDNVRLFHARAEDFLQANPENMHRESYDYVFARALAPLPTLLEYTLPALHLGGELIAMKGPNAQQEIKEAQNALSVLGGEVVEIDDFTWTEQEYERVNLRIRKITATPDRYPRGRGKAKKRPL